MQKTLTQNGRTVSYIEQGEGEPLLFLHGWAAPAETYRLVLDHLATRYHVFAPDLAGFGGSDEPTEPWGVDDYVQFTLDFAAAVGIESAVAMGHSYGCRIWLKILSREPCPLQVKKAVLMDAAGLKPQHGIDWYLRVYTYKAVKKVMASAPMRALFPKAIEKAQARFGSTDYRNASSMMRATMSKSVSEDLSACLPHIKASTLLIWGECDDATPLADGKRMEAEIPDAGLVVLAGAGHFAFAERWAQCRAVLDAFL